MSPLSYLLVVAGLGVLLGGSLVPARADIIAYVDENGRRVYVNTEDQELRAAVERGGASAARRLIERRRRALAGIEQHISEVAERHSIDPKLVTAIIEVESAWNPHARSSKGALGLMQLMPETGVRFGVRRLYDPRENITGGVRYLRFLFDRFDNDLELALAAYNAGENAVTRTGGVPPIRETRQYLGRVQSLYGKMGRGRVQGTDRIYRMADEQGRIVFTNE